MKVRKKKLDSRDVLSIIKVFSHLPSYEKLLEAELSFIDRIEDNKYINSNYFYLYS